MSCPVKNTKSNLSDETKGEKNNSLSPSSRTGLAEVNSVFGNKTDDSSTSACPIDHKTITKYNDAASDVAFGQERLANQKKLLSTSRSTSTIPKSDFTPDHQPKNLENWIYPSEQQYYNAMKRKGYNPSEDDVPVILAIHNLVNEKGWSKVREWESLAGCLNPKLKRFIGRPKDLTPKARFLNFLGYSLPFDRHDWIIDRDDGTEVRYVIDFYTGHQHKYGSQPLAPIAMHLDVRPALDSVRSIYERIDYFYRVNFRPNSFPRINIEKGNHS